MHEKAPFDILRWRLTVRWRHHSPSSLLGFSLLFASPLFAAFVPSSLTPTHIAGVRLVPPLQHTHCIHCHAAEEDSHSDATDPPRESSVLVVVSACSLSPLPPPFSSHHATHPFIVSVCPPVPPARTLYPGTTTQHSRSTRMRFYNS